MKFSIGYNYDLEMLDLLDAYKGHIDAFYFPMPQRFASSGRRTAVQPNSYPDDIAAIIKKCNSLKIKSQLLLNASCEGKWGLDQKFFNPILNYIGKLKDAGLDSLIVANPIYIGIIKREIEGLIIESSVNCYVRTPEHALYLRELGVEVLTIDRDINRDTGLIEDIKKKTGMKIRMVLNEGCLAHCPYRVNHYNYLSHGYASRKRSIKGILPDRFCIDIYSRDPLKVFRIPFVPPEELGRYKHLVDYYKLSTRVFSTKKTEHCLNAYINKNFKGNLLQILDSPGLDYFEYIDYGSLRKNRFFEKMLNCKLKCDKCGYCNSLFGKAVVIRRDYLKEINAEHEKKTIRIYRQYIKRGIDDQSKSEAYFRIGESYFGLLKYKVAVKNIKNALRLNYKSAEAYKILEYCYEKLGNFIKAIKVLKTWEKINPEDSRINYALARCYSQNKNRGLAGKEADKLIKKIKAP